MARIVMQHCARPQCGSARTIEDTGERVDPWFCGDDCRARAVGYEFRRARERAGLAREERPPTDRRPFWMRGN